MSNSMLEPEGSVRASEWRPRQRNSPAQRNLLRKLDPRRTAEKLSLAGRREARPRTMSIWSAWWRYGNAALVKIELQRTAFGRRILLFSRARVRWNVGLGDQLSSGNVVAVLLDAKSGDQIDETGYDFHEATSSFDASAIKINRLGSFKSNSIPRGAKRRA